MSDTARKAVITTAQVQEALKAYNDFRTEIGRPVLGTEFDKGARGKGFAVYSPTGEVVNYYETKEEAYVYFTRWVEVGNEILGASHVTVTKPDSKKTAKPASETKAPNGAAEKPAA